MSFDPDPDEIAKAVQDGDVAWLASVVAYAFEERDRLAATLAEVPALGARVLAALRDISAEANEWEAQHRSADPNAPPDYASGLRSAAYDIEEALAIGAARPGTRPSEGGAMSDTSKPWGSSLSDEDHAVVARAEIVVRLREKGATTNVDTAELRRLCELVRDLDDKVLSERMGADL